MENIITIVILVLFGIATIWFFFIWEKPEQNNEHGQQHGGGAAAVTAQSAPAPPSGVHGEIERLIARGKIEEARFYLQKIAYGMVGPGVDPREKAVFTELMKRFALIDPLYREIMALVQPAIIAQPGVLQSDLIKRFPLYDPERIRYVLYFAHGLGDLYRVKKGRSYAMYPEPVTLEAAPK